MSDSNPNSSLFDYLGSDPATIQESISKRLVFRIGKDPYTATSWDWLQALSYVVRDRLIERWMETQRSYYRSDAKRVYYLSLEFLIGRSLTNSMLNLGFLEDCSKALQELGLDLGELEELEHDAALGNGGLGRLAACILDSIATLNLPGVGYGIRYEYGMFRQRLEEGRQVEHPENWLANGNPWEFPRPEVVYSVRFGGQVGEFIGKDGRHQFTWGGGEEVVAMAYDTPIPGYHTDTVNNLRLWTARATRDFDLQCFNQGEYIKAVEGQTFSENLSKVLYPSDRTHENQKLRLKQQYFFVSASLQDILRRYLKDHTDLRELPDKVAIQLNDTHPAIAIPELMRLLVDVYHLEWQPAWDITVRTFSYTNHTLLPEALETWPVGLFDMMLPRHLQLIYEINRRFLLTVENEHPGDLDLMRRMSIISEGDGRRIRMSTLAVIGSHRVNGVSALHTRLLKESTFADFDRFFPQRIVNVTNGITPRRWLNLANKPLSTLIIGAIGSEWV
jgi:starch phosphorylase